MPHPAPLPKTLYLIRHGETEFNRRGMVQGSGIDAELNDRGHEQARQFFMHYASEGFCHVYTSALKRTRQTVSRFIEMGLPWTPLADLNEISWGHKEGRPITGADDEAYYKTLYAWAAGQTHLSFPGGESPDQVAERLTRAIALILERTPEGGRVLVCLHGRALRILLCLLLRHPLSGMEAFGHRNLCLYKAVHTGSVFQLPVCNLNLPEIPSRPLP